MLVTIAIVAYNEEEHLNQILNDVLHQTYDKKKIEVLLIDSMSTDQTRTMMTAFQDKNRDLFYEIKVLENKGRIQSAGWNVAIDSFSTEVLFRIDAHSSIPEFFVENNVKGLKSGEFVTGGARPTIVSEDSFFQRLSLTAENSMFGSSVSNFRKGTKKQYVKSIFHGAYKREVLEKVGHFNEKLGRTEDNEFHYRIRQAGYQICMLSDVVSYQMIRASIGKSLKQKYGNGYWVGLTLGVCPGCISLYHLVPFAFVMGILLTTILVFPGIWQLAALMWGLYGLVAVLMAVLAAATEKVSVLEKVSYLIILPFLFLGLHLSYGIGTLVGLIKLPFCKKQLME